MNFIECIIKESSGPCHEDPVGPECKAEIFIIYIPIPSQSKKTCLKSDLEILYFFFELFYLSLIRPLRNKINRKRNS